MPAPPTTTHRPHELYLHDLRWSVRTIGRNWWFLVAVLAIDVGLVTAARLLPVLAILFWLCFVGLAGTERLLFLRAYLGDRLGPGDALAATARFLGRFLLLGLWVALFFVLPAFVLGIVAGITAHAGTAHHVRISRWWIRGLLLWFAVVSDVLLTFVVPALALSTTKTMEAVRFGRRMLRASWPTARWYALTPGLTITAIALLIPVSVLGYWGAVVVGLAGTALGLSFKGAVVPFYLQRTPGVTHWGSLG
jgi:hypothetical protein